jgi:hypothetical protein
MASDYTFSLVLIVLSVRQFMDSDYTFGIFQNLRQ